MKRCCTLKRLSTLALGLGLVLLVAGSVWACPGCKDALAAQDGEQGDLVSGYFWSILFMMSMPFVLLGTFGTSMYVAVRRARPADPAAPRPEPRSDDQLAQI